VFTDRPLAGNQLAVFTDATDIPEELLQPLAREMAFSETVFVYRPEADGHVRIRIFTPTLELPFAGHPILGTAFVLGAPLQLIEIRLETGAGVVPVVLEREGPRIIFGWMSQPIPTWQPYEREAELLAALGVNGSELPVDVYDLGPTHAYVKLPSEEVVAGRTASPAPIRAGRRGCSHRFTGWPRIRRRGRRRGPWPCTCFATA
jgi:trans-2,3-dihydro-3-hydroxyanthranilate isomerase